MDFREDRPPEFPKTRASPAISTSRVFPNSGRHRMMGRIACMSGMLLAALTAGGCASPAAPPAGPALPNPPTFTYPPTRQAGDSQRTIDVDGMERTYLLHVPPGLCKSSLVPLVLVFHGHRMNAEYMIAMTEFNAVADAERFLVAYPSGTGTPQMLSFNGGLCCGSAAREGINEAAFVRRMLEELEADFSIDPARIFAAGFSNGAILAYRLGCEMSETFAAIAPVAGNMMFSSCTPRQEVSVIHVHGLNDSSAPYEDSDLDPGTDPAVLSVKGSVAFWAAFDGCAEAASEEQAGIVTRLSSSGCSAGTAVELYTLRGIGHAWPPESLWPASRILWDFFASHPKQDTL
jgi:polyhydroxybutyrate depolymerase